MSKIHIYAYAFSNIRVDTFKTIPINENKLFFWHLLTNIKLLTTVKYLQNMCDISILFTHRPIDA